MIVVRILRVRIQDNERARSRTAAQSSESKIRPLQTLPSGTLAEDTLGPAATVRGTLKTGKDISLSNVRPAPSFAQPASASGWAPEDLGDTSMKIKSDDSACIYSNQSAWSLNLDQPLLLQCCIRYEFL